ncbi:MAG: bestrophin [Ignavibacteria bacterium]|nr:bestrophin [Ignavibacteria bacterium]
MKILKSLILIINIKSVIITVLSLIATYLCLHFGIMADLPQTVIGIAVVFPIVFSIGSAYQRRENALKDYSNLKAHSRSIYLAARDWFEDENPEQLAAVKQIILDLLISCREFFTAERDEKEEKEIIVYKNYSKLSLFIKDLRIRGMQVGELSRVNQYLSKMLEAFENLKHVSQYRTPITLRAYSRFFITLTPILYAPYFAFIGKNISLELTMITPLLMSVVLVGLDNIQDHLENPFDQIGEDDVKIHAEKLTQYLEL